MTITVFHNPRCSKSRETLQLVRDKGYQPTVVEYLKTPPDAATLEQLLQLLGLKPRDLLRAKETEYLELGLDNPALTDSELVQAMVACPKLIERPIVVRGTQAVIGRPPEKVLDIL